MLGGEMEPIKIFEDDLIDKMDEKTRSQYLSFKRRDRRFQVFMIISIIIIILVLSIFIFSPLSQPPRSGQTYSFLPLLFILIYFLFHTCILLFFMISIHLKREQWAMWLGIPLETLARWVLII
jgi:uncharacterized membrane protein YhaH (DUF805 family)